MCGVVERKKLLHHVLHNVAHAGWCSAAPANLIDSLATSKPMDSAAYACRLTPADSDASVSNRNVLVFMCRYATLYMQASGS